MSFRFSPRYFLLLLLMHGAATITLYATAMSSAFKWAAIVSAGVSLAYHLARDIFIRLPDSWQEISIEQDSVRVILADGSSLRGKVSGTTIVSPYCIVFRAMLDSHRFAASRVVFPDSLSPGEFRKLCVDLKFA